MATTKNQKIIITIGPKNLNNTNKNSLVSIPQQKSNTNPTSSMSYKNIIQSKKNTIDTLNNSTTTQKNSKKSDLTISEKLLDNVLQNEKLTNKLYPIAADMYTDSRTNFSRARKKTNTRVIDNLNSLEPKTVKALKNYGVKSDERGVYYNAESEFSKKFGKSRELKKAVDKSLTDIEKGIFKGEDLNFNAKLSDAIVDKDKFDRYSSIQNAKLIDAYIDENGKKHGRFIDNYDFNKRPDTLKNIPNNHGYSLQKNGSLENFFTVMDVIIDDEEEKEKLLNKLIKRR